MRNVAMNELLMLHSMLSTQELLLIFGISLFLSTVAIATTKGDK